MQESVVDGYHLFGAEALLKRLQALTQEIEGVRRAEDIECIHRMRVASRRLRSALPLFAECLPRKRAAEWLKQMRGVTRALGAARDTDVQLDYLRHARQTLPEPRCCPGVDRLLLRLQQKRDGLQASVAAALDRFEADRVAEEMGQFLRRTIVQARLEQAPMHSPTLYRQAFLAITLRLEEMLSYEDCVSHPERVEELHAMRIAAKRLRYTMEVFGPAYPDELKEPLKAVREAQELLGDIHDCDVWVQYLPRFLEEESARTLAYFGHARPMRRLAPGILHLQQERREQRVRRYREFVKFWEQTREQGTWNELRRLVQPQAREEASSHHPAGDGR